MSRRSLDRSSYGIGENFSSEQYKLLADYEIEIMYQPLTITKYINSLLKIQSHETASYYPITEDQVKTFFKSIGPSFHYPNIKYSSSGEIEMAARIISFIGESGYNYIKSVYNVSPLNQPTLLFYGVEQLATFFTYIFFNFTQENTKINSIRGNFRKHGFDSWQFTNIKSSLSIDNLLQTKIKLLKVGAAQRFFLTLGFPVEKFFFKELELSLLDLMQNFFTNLRIGLGNDLVSKFIDDFSLEERVKIEYHQDLDLFIFYCLSYLFSHLSRYKIFTWQKLLQTNEKNLGFYIKFLIKKIEDLFLRKIFSILSYEKDQIWILLRHPQRIESL